MAASRGRRVAKRPVAKYENDMEINKGVISGLIKIAEIIIIINLRKEISKMSGRKPDKSVVCWRRPFAENVREN